MVALVIDLGQLWLRATGRCFALSRVCSNLTGIPSYSSEFVPMSRTRCQDSAQKADSAIYKALLESTKAIPWKLDWHSMEFVYIGPQIEQILGWSPESWVTIDDWANRMHPDDRHWVVDFCVSQSREGADHEADYRALTKSGEYRWIRDVVHVMRDEDGNVEALVGFMFDIHERKRTELELVRLQKELEALSYKDGLTGVANRRMFDETLAEEWAGARRHRQPLSLILLDIDFFKQYNDHFGHVQGDESLRQVAQALAGAATRPRDFVARYGGEEFVLVLPETDARAAHLIAERCRNQIFKLQIAHPSSAVSQVLTVSLGLGTRIPGHGDEPTAFLRQVDECLYNAKQQGRNRLVSLA